MKKINKIIIILYGLFIMNGLHAETKNALAVQIDNKILTEDISTLIKDLQWAITNKQSGAYFKKIADNAQALVVKIKNAPTITEKTMLIAELANEAFKSGVLQSYVKNALLLLSIDPNKKGESYELAQKELSTANSYADIVRLAAEEGAIAFVQ